MRVLAITVRLRALAAPLLSAVKEITRSSSGLETKRLEKTILPERRIFFCFVPSCRHVGTKAAKRENNVNETNIKVGCSVRKPTH